MTISAIQIAMFGGLQLSQDDKVVSHFPTRKCAALLAYLAFYKERRHAREQLTDRFWPDMAPDAARHNLRQTLFSLRGLLEPPGVPRGSILIADKTYVSLYADTVTTDVQRFKSALSIAEHSPQERRVALIEAIALYRGELLPEIYEEWALTEREHLAAAYLTALERLAEEWEQSDHWEQAVDCLHRLILTDPFHVTAQERLIRLHATTGHPERARQQFHKLATMLASEWNEKPARELCAFVETLPVPSSPALNWTGPVLLASPEPLPGALNIPSPHLPASLTRFFGRVEELQEIQTLLTAPQRCVLTLLGLGGVGKTRMAVEIGHRLAPTFQNSVYFVSLAGLSEPQNIPMAIMNCLALTPSLSADPLEQITTALESAPSLLILDNMEHLLSVDTEIVVQILSHLTQRVSTLRCLVTSRQCLHCEGEREYLLHPLPVPASSEVIEKLFKVPSVALFLDRAQAIRPHFTLTANNASAVAALCQRLEGVPLALELAAAQIGVFAPTQMLAQLDNRFKFLVHRGQGIAVRHRSLYAALKWSTDLLSPPLYDIFLCLSIFRGGWALEAARAVCAVEEIAEGLHHLREVSLIVAEEQGDTVRFYMLEMMREFADARLTTEQRHELGRRHATYFQQTMLESAPCLSGSNAYTLLEQLEEEHDNLRVALRWHRNCDPSNLQLTNLMWAFWYIRSYYGEARAWITEALACDRGEFPSLRAHTLNAAGTLAWYQGDLTAARVHFNEALVINQRFNNRIGTASILSHLALVVRDEGDYSAARAFAEHSLLTARQIPHDPCIVFALYNLGCITLLQGDYQAAEVFLRDCVLMRRTQGDNWGLGFTLIVQGELACARGQNMQAAALFKESLFLFQDMGDQQGLSGALHGLGKIALACEEYEEARAYLLKSLQIKHETGHQTGVQQVLCSLIFLAAATKQWQRAAHMLGAIAVKKHIPLLPSEIARMRVVQTEVQAVLGEAGFSVAYAEGSVLNYEQVINFARGS